LAAKLKLLPKFDSIVPVKMQAGFERGPLLISLPQGLLGLPSTT